MIKYWPESLPTHPAIGFDPSPMSVHAEFSPAVGEPITRPRTTSRPITARPKFFLRGAQISAFNDFFLSVGSQRFAMRYTIDDEVKYVRIVKDTYDRVFRSDGFAEVTFDMMILPIAAWFAPYARAGLSTVPYFVADYANGVYGIDGSKVAASELTTIAGTYDVQRTVSGMMTETEETLIAGDIPATAPANTTLIVGFLT